MKIAPLALVFLGLMACNGGNSPMTPTKKGARLAVTGSVCQGRIYIQTPTVNGGAMTEYDDIAFPWAENLSPASGDHVYFAACSTCLSSECTTNGCNVTTDLYWQGHRSATDTSDGITTPGICEPYASVNVTIP